MQNGCAFKSVYWLQSMRVRSDRARINRITVCAQDEADLIQDEDVGFSVISTDDIDDIGINEVIRRIRARIADNPVYLRRVWR
jgi:hypothetical protein